MRRRTALLVLAAAAAVAAALVLGVSEGWWRSARTPAPRDRISGHASLSSTAVRFGDSLTARLEVVLSPGAIDPGSVRVAPRFAPYRVRSVERKTGGAGRAALVLYRFALECVTATCVPERPQVELRFPPASVLYRTRAGGRGRMEVAWRSLQLGSRLDEADRAEPLAHLRAGGALPPVSYRFSPGTLAALLLAGAALLVLLAGTLVGLSLRRSQTSGQPLDGPAPTAVELALRLVRASASNGAPEERRRALERLARELRGLGRAELALAAGRLAWSAEQPSPAAASAFASNVERELEERA